MSGRRMVLADISAGTKGILAKFEQQIRSHAKMNVCSHFPNTLQECAVIEQNYLAARQAMLRKIYRLENGTNLTDVERVKKDLRRLAKGYVEAVTNGKDSHELWVLALSITEGKRRL